MFRPKPKPNSANMADDDFHDDFIEA
jgi:hypothetical protein